MAAYDWENALNNAMPPTEIFRDTVRARAERERRL
jgi:hypothetical protein